MLTITDAASRKLTEVIRQQSEHGGEVYGLRISAAPGCCSGAQYGMSLAKQAEQGDWEAEFGGVKVLVDTESAPFLKGVSIDYVETPGGLGLHHQEPERRREARGRLRFRLLLRLRGPALSTSLDPGSQARPFAEFAALPAGEIRERTRAAKRALGSRLVILGHHYQRESVVEFADFRGDSLKLSQLAARQQEAEFIVFCGVHFMAESADILRRPHQTVILPDLKAGCSMADMAGGEDVEEAWERLVAAHGDTLLPVTYMNSTAELKAFCGARGGVVCTSSNARAVLEWAWERKPRVFFFPDQHLGRNTAFAMGVPLEHMAEWDWRAEDLDRGERALLRRRTPPRSCGAASAPCTRSSRSRRWTRRARRTRRVKVLVHPECPFDVVRERGPGRLDRVHHRAGAAGAARHALGHRHRDQPGAPARARAPGAADPVAPEERLPLRHDEPHRPRAPAVGAREPGRGAPGQRRPGARDREALRPGGARPDAEPQGHGAGPRGPLAKD